MDTKKNIVYRKLLTAKDKKKKFQIRKNMCKTASKHDTNPKKKYNFDKIISQ